MGQGLLDETRIGKMKVLICGNGPGVEKTIGQLEEFDHVVRINQWKKYCDPNARCDAWAFYPFHAKGMQSEKYDVNDYLPVDYIWMAHPGFWGECWFLTGKLPYLQVGMSTVKELHKEVGYEKPTSGIVILKMAIKLGFDTTAVGFNFYNGKKVHEGHRPDLDKAWFYRQVETEKLKEWA